MRSLPRAGRLALLAFLLATLTAWPSSSRAQDDDLDTDLLFRITLEKGVLPEAPAFVRLVRIILEPGASSPTHTHTGPELGRVEAGTLTVQVDGPALVKRRDSSSEEAFEEAVQGAAFDLERGEQIAYLPGTPMTFRNDGDETVRILAAVILPAAEDAGPRISYADGDPDEAALEGLTSQVLGDGVATVLPADGASIVIERVRLKAKQDLPGERNPSLLSVESGDFAFDLEKGLAQVSRTAKPGPQADMEAGDDTTLAERDAVFFPNGFGTADREDQAEGLTYVRMVIAPSAEDERLTDDGRGTITFNEPKPRATEAPDDGSGSSGDETPTPDDAADGTVFVNSFDVNMRAEPSTGADIVATYQTGAPMTLTGDAVEAEGITWYPVTSQDDGASGYVSAEFLSRQADGSEPL